MARSQAAFVAVGIPYGLALAAGAVVARGGYTTASVGGAVITLAALVLYLVSRCSDRARAP